MWKSDIAKINDRIGVKLHVVIVSPPVSSSTCVMSASAATFLRMMCVVIGVKGSDCSDR